MSRVLRLALVLISMCAARREACAQSFGPGWPTAAFVLSDESTEYLARADQVIVAQVKEAVRKRVSGPPPRSGAEWDLVQDGIRSDLAPLTGAFTSKDDHADWARAHEAFLVSRIIESLPTQVHPAPRGDPVNVLGCYDLVAVLRKHFALHDTLIRVSTPCREQLVAACAEAGRCWALVHIGVVEPWVDPTARAIGSLRQAIARAEIELLEDEKLRIDLTIARVPAMARSSGLEQVLREARVNEQIGMGLAHLADRFHDEIFHEWEQIASVMREGALKGEPEFGLSDHAAERVEEGVARIIAIERGTRASAVAIIGHGGADLSDVERMVLRLQDQVTAPAATIPAP